MINGVHALLYAKDADRTRAFLRDVLGLPHVDAGGGWLIFALPPAELGVHPEEGELHHQLYFMCDNAAATVAELAAKGVRCSEVKDQGWGLVTSVEVPGAGSIGIYQPKHPTAVRVAKTTRRKAAVSRKPPAKSASRRILTSRTKRTSPKKRSSPRSR
jgi:catechol 2,3-dioxygenase-like lactoylglutathione lyase family enzyme